MAEQGPKPRSPEKPGMVISDLSLDTIKNSSSRMASPSSTPSTPIGLQKSNSGKYTCLCSPTTHAGSFRCRYHRNPSLMRSSFSVGGKLSDLAGKTAGISDTLRAQ